MLPIYLAELDTQEEKDLFEKLYREYKSKMFSIASGILNNEADAEDAVDMAFHRLAKNFTKISNKNCNETEGYIVICIRTLLFSATPCRLDLRPHQCRMEV